MSQRLTRAPSIFMAAEKQRPKKRLFCACPVSVGLEARAPVGGLLRVAEAPLLGCGLSGCPTRRPILRAPTCARVRTAPV